MSVRRIIWWRHGQTDSNHQGRFQGQHDVPLNDTGRAQVAAAVKVLTSHLAVPDADGTVQIVSSDLSRAVDTAQALANQLQVSVATDPRLRERDFGNWEGLTRTEIEHAYPEELQRWLAGNDLPVGGGETAAQVSVRVTQAAREWSQYPASTLVLVGHGGAIRSGVIGLAGWSAQSARTLAVVRNAAWVIMEYRKAEWILVTYNESYLPRLE